MKSGRTCAQTSVSDEKKGSCLSESHTSATGDSVVYVAGLPVTLSVFLMAFRKIVDQSMRLNDFDPAII